MESNRKRRDKRSEAIKELKRRQGNEAISTLVKSFGRNPFNTLMQLIRKLAGKVQVGEGILRINQVMYNRITTLKKEVKAIKEVIPSDIDKVSGIFNPLPLTTKE